MKQARLLVCLLLLVGFFASNAGSGQNNKPPQEKNKPEETNLKEIEWMAYDVGLQKAKAEEKHVFIDFTAKWCGWCKKMDQETFSRPEVIEMINTNFVPVKVDADSKHELNIDGYKITEKNLTRHEFGVRGFPSYWFLKPDGTKLAKIRGYQPANYMMEVLAYIKDYKYDSTQTESRGGKKDKP